MSIGVTVCVVFFETSEYDKAPKKAVQSANNKRKNNQHSYNRAFVPDVVGASVSQHCKVLWIKAL